MLVGLTDGFHAYAGISIPGCHHGCSDTGVPL
jgi:hypothetical protein